MTSLDDTAPAIHSIVADLWHSFFRTTLDALMAYGRTR